MDWQVNDLVGLKTSNGDNNSSYYIGRIISRADDGKLQVIWLAISGVGKLRKPSQPIWYDKLVPRFQVCTEEDLAMLILGA